MIHIFFDPGSFGSTIEYVLHTFSDLEQKNCGVILSDGSMHSYAKHCHVFDTDTVESLLPRPLAQNSICTPIYPHKDRKLPDIIDIFSQLPSWPIDKKILIHQPNLRAVELNMLFKYHKVVTGSLNMGLDIIVGNNRHNLAGWNRDYTHWSDMKHWELREWLSIFYASYAEELIAASDNVDESWLVISNTDLIFNTVNTWHSIMKFCQFGVYGDMNQFADRWIKAQQYIVSEFDLLDKIVAASVSNDIFEWAPNNIVAEAIIQQRLRNLGYEIRCDGLDIFPTDAKILHSLLDKVAQ